MLCRAVLAAVAISYLICVLWLSGMQKEDLDVNMLRKLQRHNVNIDDMSPESLKRQCLDFPSNKKNVSKQVKDERNDDENKTTTEGVKLEKDTKKIKKLLKNDLKMILNNLMESTTIKSINNKFDKSLSIKKEKTSNYKPITPKTVQPMNKHEDGEVSMFSGDLIKKLKYNIYQPNIGNVQQFWQMFTSTTSSYNGELDNDDIREHTGTSLRPAEATHEQTTIITNSQKSRSEETDYINKLIADLINNRAKVKTEKPTTSPIDLKKISDQLEKLLKLYPQSSTGVPPRSVNTLREYETEKTINEQSNSNDFVKNNVPNKMLSNTRFYQYDSYVNNNNQTLETLSNDEFKEYSSSAQYSKDYNQKEQSIENRQSNSNHFVNNVIPKKILLKDEVKQYDGSVLNNNDYNDQLSFPQSSKNGASISYTIPKLALNDKQIMVPSRYQNEEDYRMVKYASRFPEQTSQDEILMQNYQTVKGYNEVAKYPNKIPVQAVNKDIELLPKYQSHEEQKIVNFPNGHSEQNKNDKSMHRYENTRDRNKFNYFPNRIPVHASGDKENELSNRHQRLENNNKKVYFHNRIPVPTLNKKDDTGKIQRYQKVNRNKMTVLDWVPQQASDKAIETLQRNPSDLQEGNEVANFRSENKRGEIPNKGPMQALEHKLDMLDNFQVIGENKMVENEMMSRYQTMEENNFETFPKKKSASAISNRQRGQHLQLQRYQPEKVNKNAFSSNKILLQAPDRKPWENQSIERTKITSYLMEVPMQTPDNKPWEMFQKYQSMHVEPTSGPKIEITKTVKDEIGSQMLSKNCIKEIAENVKAIVLKDLRQETTTTVITTPSTTTTTISTTSTTEDKTTTHEPIKRTTRNNLPQNKTQEATQVMEKFIALLEQFKDIKEKKELESTSHVTHQDKSQFIANLQLGPRGIYRVERPQENPFAAQIPRVYNRINNDNFILMGSVPASGMRQPPQGSPRVQAKPIMIQTNSDEIQPLGVLLKKPFTLIHQNIVVTTTPRAPLQRGHSNKRVEKYDQQDEGNKGNNNNKNKETIKLRVSASGRKPLKLYKQEASDTSFKEKNTYEHNRYDRLRDFKARLKDSTQPESKMTYRLMPQAKQREYKKSKLGQTSYKDDEQNLYKVKNDRVYNSKLIYGKPFQSSTYNQDSKKNWLLKPPYDEVTNFKSNEEKREYDDERKRYSDTTYDLLSRNRNPSRFHERLERVDDRVDYENGKGDAVASRQQQPLNMKDPRFDDSHFKNFLKTQQKVNEMLEKILSSKKSPTKGARSFETT